MHLEVISMSYISGLILGLTLILPFGPQNLFVLNQGVLSGLRRGLVAVAAAGFCDSVLIVSGAAGLSAIFSSLPWLRIGLLGVGAIFLFMIGLKSLRGHKASIREAGETRSAEGRRASSVPRIMLTGMAVSWVNPHKILDTIAVLGSTIAAQMAASRVAFAAGAVSASWVFFLVLALTGALCGTWLTPAAQVWIRRISGVIMLAFAGLLVWEACMAHLVTA
jgi:L-lysine exporter family protein LysE/ArgO